MSSPSLRACSPYGPMKSAIVVPQEEANIEKNLLMTIIYIHRLEIQQQTLSEIITVFRPLFDRGGPSKAFVGENHNC